MFRGPTGGIYRTTLAHFQHTHAMGLTHFSQHYGRVSKERGWRHLQLQAHKSISEERSGKSISQIRSPIRIRIETRLDVFALKKRQQTCGRTANKNTRTRGAEKMQMVKKPANIYLWFSLSLPVPLSASGRYSTSTLFQSGIRGRATPASISLHSACFIFNDSTYTATIGGNCKHLYKLTFSCRSCHLESRTKDTRHTDDIGECCQVRGAEFSGWPGEVMVIQVADRSLSPQILPHAPHPQSQFQPHSHCHGPFPASGSCSCFIIVMAILQVVVHC